MNIREIIVRPHPSREIFRQNKISIKTVAKALGLSYNHTVAMLSGSLRITPKNEVKLKIFCEQLKNANRRNNDAQEKN
jgi:hypothetical protein